MPASPSLRRLSKDRGSKLAWTTQQCPSQKQQSKAEQQASAGGGLLSCSCNKITEKQLKRQRTSFGSQFKAVLSWQEEFGGGSSRQMVTLHLHTRVTNAGAQHTFSRSPTYGVVLCAFGVCLPTSIYSRKSFTDKPTSLCPW